MTVNQPRLKAVTATSLGGPMTGYINPKTGLTERSDEDGNTCVKFTLMVVVEVEVDEYITTTEAREFTVWAKGKNARILLDAFPDGFEKVTKEHALVTVDLADMKLLNYPVTETDEETKKAKTTWVREISVLARSVSLPNI